MITGTALRDARVAAGKTQGEVARLVGVSLRTVGNWERGPVVPPKHWRVLYSALPTLDARDEDQAMMEGLREGVGRRVEAAARGKSSAVEDVAVSANAAIDFADRAAKADAHPLMIIDLVEAVTNIVIETGAVSLKLPNGESVMDSVLSRGVAITHQAIEDLSPDRKEPFKVELALPRAALRAKIADQHSANAGGTVAMSEPDVYASSDTTNVTQGRFGSESAEQEDLREVARPKDPEPTDEQ